MVLNPSSKLLIFTQPIDEKYCVNNNVSVEYYSYEGCNIQEIDNLINKSDRKKQSEDELNHIQEHACVVEQETESKFKSGISNRKLSDYLTNTWKENLKVIKQSNNGQSASNDNRQCQLSRLSIEARKLTFDVGPTRLGGKQLFHNRGGEPAN